MLIAHIRTSSHQLRCQTGRWMILKRSGQIRYYIQGAVETQLILHHEVSNLKEY